MNRRTLLTTTSCALIAASAALSEPAGVTVDDKRELNLESSTGTHTSRDAILVTGNVTHLKQRMKGTHLSWS
jgi:hypothetical protein